MKKPANYTTCFPYLFVNDSNAYLKFLTEGLGGIVEGKSLNPDETVANAQIRFDDTVVMVSEAQANYPASRASFYLFVEDADASMAQALANGGELEMEAANMEYGDRQGGVRDSQGNIWWISQHLGDGY